MNRATQTDAFARGVSHGHGEGEAALKEIKRPDNSASKDIKRPDDGKYHTVLNHPEERDASSHSVTSSDLKAKGPEEITVDNEAEAAVTVGSIGQAAVTVGGTGLGAVTVGDSGVLGVVYEDDVGAVHPESKTQQNNKKKSAADNCYSRPSSC